MTIILMLEEYFRMWDEAKELWEEAEYTSRSLEKYETILPMPTYLGQGYAKDIEVFPNLCLTIGNYLYHDDLHIQKPGGEHPLHFDIALSGKIKSDYGTLGNGCTLISGGGIQARKIDRIDKFDQILSVHIYMGQPLMLANFFPGEDGELLPQLKMLTRNNDWQERIYLKMTPALQGVAQQIINCPFCGITKQVYLQGKVLEWMALQLAPIIAGDRNYKSTTPGFKPKTIDQLHHAREILLSRLENPPSLLELAVMVGVSPRTLKRGFPELFGTTVFGYLCDRRMEYAQKLLRQGNLTVIEVANIVGYSNPGHFAAAFKRRFCITPKQYLKQLSVNS
ncbi:helix-turn-helix transcriptional regulator [Chlorogloeopsis fritschii PCC 9212]